MSSPWEPPRDPSSSSSAEDPDARLRPYSDPYASDPYSASSYGSGSYGPYGAGAQGASPYGSPHDQPYGSGPYGAGSYGADPYSSAPYTPAPYPAGPYPAYGPGSYGGYQPAPPASGLAIAALVCGILGFFTAGVTSIPAVICGHLAWRDTSSGSHSGHGMTIAGLVLGYLPIAGWVVFWLFFFTLASV